jgi:hypothetical protein
VFIETNSAFLSKGWPLTKKPIFPLVYHMRLGEQFRVEGNVQSFVNRLEQYYRDQLSAQPASQTVIDPATAPRPGPAL